MRIGPALAIPDILRSLGVDPAPVLVEAGLDPRAFDNPDNRISYTARGRLLSLCVARSGCPHFGLLLGNRAGLQSFGLVGLLVKYSPDLGTALRYMSRHLHLHVRGAAVGLRVDGDRAILSYDIHHPNVDATDQLADAAVAIMLNVVRSMCNPDWMPVEARFAHRRPRDVAAHSRFFRVPLIFDAEENALVLETRDLDRALPHTDPDLHGLLLKQIEALEARHGDDFPQQVRAVLRTALLTDRAKADQVAAMFSMHRRTLVRRLTNFGFSYQQLVDETRFEIARQFLENSAMDLSHIAAALDYADASAFTRAFRRWSGTTPGQWRAGLRAAASDRA